MEYSASVNRIMSARRVYIDIKKLRHTERDLTVKLDYEGLEHKIFINFLFQVAVNKEKFSNCSHLIKRYQIKSSDKYTNSHYLL